VAAHDRDDRQDAERHDEDLRAAARSGDATIIATIIMSARLSEVTTTAVELVASARLVVETRGPGFTDITREAARFLGEAGAGEGVLYLFLRHISASLVIQENADPDVQTDLVTALARIAPENAGWVHDTEGPDDMPAHVKTMVTGVSLHVPVTKGAPALGTWQGIYLAEHRASPHRREVVLQFVGGRQ
jgi:secondary thiamine-phosphate synthase enzyme